MAGKAGWAGLGRAELSGLVALAAAGWAGWAGRAGGGWLGWLGWDGWISGSPAGWAGIGWIFRSPPPFLPLFLLAVHHRLPDGAGTNGVVAELPRIPLMNFHVKMWANDGICPNVANYGKVWQI